MQKLQMGKEDNPEALADTSYVLNRFRGDDRRRFRRWPVNISIRELRPESHIYRATCLSGGGFFCPDAVPRLAGEELTVEVDFSKGEPFVTVARVVHCGGGNNGMGLALQFAAPQRQLEALLNDTLGAFDWGGSTFGE